MFLGHLNIKSIKNKFEFVWELMKDTFDLFLVSESNLTQASQMTNSQFLTAD